MKSSKYLLIAITSFTVCLNAQWTNTGGPPINRSNQALVTNGLNIFSGTNGGMVRSTQGGGSWLNIDNGLGSYTNIRSVIFSPNYLNQDGSLICGTTSGGIFNSNDYGDQWTAFPNDTLNIPGSPNVNSIISYLDAVWIGTDKGVFYHRFEGSWYSKNLGLPSASDTKVLSLIVKDGHFFVGTEYGVYKLSNQYWSEKNNGLLNTNVVALTYSGQYLIAVCAQGSNEGVYISSDDGENWTYSFSVAFPTSLLAIGQNIFVGSFGDGVWLSTNNGSTWNQINDGFAGSAYYVLSLASNEDDVFAGTNAAGVWKRPLSQIISDVDDERAISPLSYSLEQNYPNPFNPSTIISFSIPVEAFVSLRVFNSIGEEAANLVNETKPAGNYSVSFYAGRLPSGIYFYKIAAGDFIQTRKMMLVK